MAKQGGLLSHVTVPRTYKAPGSHKVELAYITKKEAKKLKELDLHNSGIGKEMNYGPMGIPNYNGGGGGFGGGFGGGDGGGGDDIREAARAVSAIASARAAPRGALERLGAQRARAAQSGPRGALERATAQRTAPIRAPVTRPAPVSRPAPARNPYVTKPYVNTLAGTTTPPVGTASKPTVTVYTKPSSGPSAYQKALGVVLGTSSSPFNMKQHFSNSEVLEQLAKRGIISGSYADELKGQDVVAQGLNKNIAWAGAIPFQIAQNTYSQYDPNNPFSSIWGGVTSGFGQGISNIKGILGYNPESNQ